MVLHELSDALAVATTSLIAVTLPGAASVRCPDARFVTAVRSDRGRDGALVERCGQSFAGTDTTLDTIVATELQWADDRSLTWIVELAVRAADRAAPGARLIVAWRQGSDRRPLAELLLLAASRGSVIDVVPDSVASLVARGTEPDQAARLVAASAGLPEWIAALEADRSIEADVAARLAVLDDSTRRSAEIVAFGGAAASVADPTALVVEGLLAPGPPVSMPTEVANAIRAVCPPERRAALVERPDDQVDVIEFASHLLSLGDRSPGSASCYLDAARRVEDGDLAAELARAARAAGANEATSRRLAADGLLAADRPGEALRELGTLDDPSDERRRARAWLALGDPAAAAAAFRRAGDPAWAAYCAVAAGLPAALDSDAADTGDVASLIASAAVRWRDGGFERPGDVLADLATAARRQTAAGDRDEPLRAGELMVRVAERLGDHAVAARAATVVTEQPAAPHATAARLLASWIDARRGVLDAASAAYATIEPRTPRTRLIHGAAQCAVVVRDTEGAGLDEAARAGLDAASSVGPDVFDVDLVTDIAAAAERARLDRADEPLAAMAAIVDAGGDHLCFDLAWCRLQAALAGDRADRIAARACEVIALDPAHDRHTAATDIRALARAVATPSDVDVVQLIAVARRVAASGAPHIAARACGFVATTTPSDAAARTLLRESRIWRSARSRDRGPAESVSTIVRLTAHEEQVARLVVEGRTHKEIGAVMFVSPKTVEHHVAHIRTKLGVTGRAAMLAALRDYLD